jgi:hypothetical protein
LDVSVWREVYNNQDLRGMWTVMDQLGIGGTIPILNLATSLIGPGGSLGFSIGAKTGVSVFEIRQILPSAYEALDSAEERARKIQNDTQFQNFLRYRDETRITTEEGIQGQWIESIDDGGSILHSFFPLNSENYARFSKFWNFALIPFKLPLTVSAFEQLDDHQILSYSGYGGVELGMSIGWNLDLTSLTGIASLGASASILMKGDYRISVMKENTSIARVKLSRSMTSAESMSVGTAETTGLLSNMIIVSNVVTDLLEVIPFQLSDTHTQQLFIDIGYRYDLNHSGGRDAYVQAVLGKFAMSDRLSLREDGSIRTDLSETGVIRDFLRTGTSTGVDEETKLKIAFIFKKNRSGNVTDVKTKITLPDGTHNIFTGVTKNRLQWSLFWNQYKKIQRNFLIQLDLDQPVESFPMTIEGKIDDTNTKQSELKRYILEVENAVGIPFLFPRTPLIMQTDYWGSHLSSEGILKSDKNLGRSTFYYQLNVTDVQVQKFIDAPEARMWGHLEKAFHIAPGKWASAASRFFYEFFRAPLIALEYPLSLLQIDIKPGINIIHAKRIYQEWLNIRTYKQVTDRVRAMSHLFMDPVFSEELIYLVRDVLHGEEVGYYVNAYHPAIGGRIVRAGGAQVHFEDEASKSSRQFDFDVAGANLIHVQPSMGVERFTADVSTAKQITLHFNLDRNPNYVYLDLALENPFPRNFHNKVLGAIFLKNEGQFHIGENKITLDTEMENRRYFEMINHLQSKQHYKMTIAIAMEANKWGPTADTKFMTP